MEDNKIYKVKMLCTHGGDHQHIVDGPFLTRNEADKRMAYREMTGGYYEIVEEELS